MNYTIKGTIRIENSDGFVLGEGRVKLLEYIGSTNSISKAAKKMDMSYRKAWEMVRSMNVRSKKPLVVTTSGGSGGGGSQLTNIGINAIHEYQKLKGRFYQFNKEQATQIKI